MKLFDENGKLQHVDNSSDVIQHYGKKGMKWGVRKVVDYAKTLGQATVNANLHPIHYARASREAAAKSALGQVLGSKRSLDYQNKRVAELRAAKSEKKAAKKALKKEGPNKYDKQIEKWDAKGGPKNKAERKEYGKLEDKSNTYWSNKRKNINNKYSDVKKNSKVKY